MGGSGFLLSLCGREFLCGTVSQLVLLEAEHNVRAKLGAQVLGQYHHLLQIIPLTVAPVPMPVAGEAWLRHVNAKDVHVIAAALAVGADYLLTLDQKLLAEVYAAALPLYPLTPGDFIRTVLPSHEDYPHLR